MGVGLDKGVRNTSPLALWEWVVELGATDAPDAASRKYIRTLNKIGAVLGGLAFLFAIVYAGLGMYSLSIVAGVCALQMAAATWLRTKGLVGISLQLTLFTYLAACVFFSASMGIESLIHLYLFSLGTTATALLPYSSRWQTAAWCMGSAVCFVWLQTDPLATIFYPISGSMVSHLLGLFTPFGLIFLLALPIITLRTENALAERALAQSRYKAESALRAKSTFLATMSHELRTPLNGVMGAAQLLETHQLNPEEQEYVTLIKRSASSLMIVLDDILEMSRIEAGPPEIAQGPFPLQGTMHEIRQILLPQAHDKGLPLELMIDDDVPLTVIGDKNRLRQILTNLLRNGLKFTNKGYILLWVKAGATKRTDGRRDLQFVVEDTGIGIPESAQTELFEAFTQVDDSVERRYNGTGLGLSICRALVEAMGGSIALKSNVGEGTQFTITLPFHVPQADSPPVAVATADAQPTRVLTAV